MDITITYKLSETEPSDPPTNVEVAPELIIADVNIDNLNVQASAETIVTSGRPLPLATSLNSTPLEVTYGK